MSTMQRLCQGWELLKPYYAKADFVYPEVEHDCLSLPLTDDAVSVPTVRDLYLLGWAQRLRPGITGTPETYEPTVGWYFET